MSSILSGVYKLTSSYAFMIDIGQMPVLRSIDNHGDSIDFGAAVTLNEILKTLTKRSSESVTFEPIAKHLKKVASVPVRNVRHCLIIQTFIMNYCHLVQINYEI